MRHKLLAVVLTSSLLVTSPNVFAQAFGEYGRAVGGIPQSQGIAGPKALDSTPRGVSGFAFSDVRSKALPVRLVVAAKEASLYPKQDDESEKVTQLIQGETLVPIVQSSGGNDWYMVRTQKGMIGWVKSTDVREENVKK